MKLWKFVVLLVCAAVLASLLTFAVFTWYQNRVPPNTQSLPYTFTVADSYGIDLGTDIFRLGQVSPGGGSSRTLHLSDPLRDAQNRTTRVQVTVRGEGSEWITPEPASGELPLAVNLTLQVPPEAKKGKYEGRILVTTLS